MPFLQSPRTPLHFPFFPLGITPPGRRNISPESAATAAFGRRLQRRQVIPHPLFWLVLPPLLCRTPLCPRLKSYRSESSSPERAKDHRRSRYLQPRRSPTPGRNRPCHPRHLDFLVAPLPVRFSVVADDHWKLAAVHIPSHRTSPEKFTGTLTR
jgi:hypothetical protein